MVREKLLATCEASTKLLKSAGERFGFSWATPQFLHCTAATAYALLDLLADEPHVRIWFHTIAVVLSFETRRKTIAQAITRMIWIMLDTKKLTSFLDEATRQIFKLIAKEIWNDKDRHSLYACTYPNYTVVYERGREFADTGELLAQYARLSLNDDTVESDVHDDHTVS